MHLHKSFINSVLDITGSQNRMITYKFRLYPGKDQREILDFSIELCRQTYNSLLEEMNNQVKIDRKTVQHKIVELKKARPELKQIYSKTLQYECYRLFSNLLSLRKLKKHGKKVGRLRFKGKDWFKTMNYNQSGFSFIQQGKKGILHLSKIGELKVRSHRIVEGKIKQITVKKSLGKWYCMIVTDFIQKRQCGEGEIGIDVGIENYIYDSNGNAYENPKHFDKYHQELKIEQQSLSKKEKGSNNRQKAKVKVAKLHEKIANAREDYIHKLSTKLIKENRFIAIEKLNIKNMISISYNAKNIVDASWGKLAMYLHYKAENAGCVVQDVNPAYTTRDCSFCGSRNNKLELSQRKFICKKCKQELPRDYNSAINILVSGKELATMEKATHTEHSVQQVASMKSEVPCASVG